MTNRGIYERIAFVCTVDKVQTLKSTGEVRVTLSLPVSEMAAAAMLLAASSETGLLLHCLMSENDFTLSNERADWVPPEDDL